MTNPYESPPEDTSPLTLTEVRRRHGRSGVQSNDFVTVGFMMQVIGGAVLLIGLILLLIHWLPGSVTLAIGAMLVVPGRGLMAYKKWAWYAAVAVALPLTLLFATFAVLLAASNPLSVALLLFPTMSGWLCWVLLSRSGRDRYRLLAESSTKRNARAKKPSPIEEVTLPEVISEPRRERLAEVNPLEDLAG